MTERNNQKDLFKKIKKIQKKYSGNNIEKKIFRKKIQKETLREKGSGFKGCFVFPAKLNFTSIFI